MTRMTIEKIPEIADLMAVQIRSRLPRVPRVESPADGDIATLFEMISVIAAAVGDLVREQGRGR